MDIDPRGNEADDNGGNDGETYLPAAAGLGHTGPILSLDFSLTKLYHIPPCVTSGRGREAVANSPEYAIIFER